MTTKTQPVITVCSSAAFYRQAADIKDDLSTKGFTVVVPKMAEEMRRTGDFEVSHYKTWFADPNDYHKKSALVRGHFDEVEQGDAVLVLNFEKRGVQNYIGGNVLMEMALAFYLNKPIFILNEIPEESSFLEEIMALQPIVLHGDADALPAKYAKVIEDQANTVSSE